MMLSKSSIILPYLVSLDLNKLIKESLGGLNGYILVGSLVFMINDYQVLVNGE